MDTLSLGRALISGTAGAAALTTVHEAVRRTSPVAPRMDVLGMRGLRKLLGRRAPVDDARLHRLALVGDLVSNTAYYALVAAGDPDRAPLRGALLGVVAGFGAVMLPPRLGLGEPPHVASVANRIMTVAWYALGGLAAGVVQRQLARRQRYWIQR